MGLGKKEQDWSWILLMRYLKDQDEPLKKEWVRERLLSYPAWQGAFEEWTEEGQEDGRPTVRQRFA